MNVVLLLGALCTSCKRDSSCVNVCEREKECPGMTDWRQPLDCEELCDRELSDDRALGCELEAETFYACYEEHFDEYCREGMADIDSCTKQTDALNTCFEKSCSDC